MGLRSRAKQNIPVGAVWWTRSSTIPPGWLECNGQPTTGYSALAAVVGANVPDLRGRVPIGVGTGSGLTPRALGTVYGSGTITLQTANMPSHSHGGGSHTHSLATHTHTTNSHGHGGVGHVHGMSHDHGPHAHQGTVMVGASYLHTHNSVSGEVSSVTGGGGAYFTGVYMYFANGAGYASYGSGGTNSHASEQPETAGPVNADSGGSASPVSSVGSGLLFGLNPPSRALTVIIKT